MCDKLDMMSEFPLLSCWEDGKYWTGFATTSHGQLIRLAIKSPHFPSALRCSLHGDNDTRQMFSPQMLKEIQEASDADPSVSVLDFVRRMIRMIDEEKGTELSTAGEFFAHNAQFYQALFNELEILGSENIERASKNFSELVLKYTDSSGRKHFQRLAISTKPKVYPSVTVELPTITDNFKWPQTIGDCYNRFKQEVEKFSSFFSVMDTLDESVRVLEPIAPKRSDTHRRFLLDSNSNVVVTLIMNPTSPWTLPEITFSGPEQRIKVFEEMLGKNCESWDENSTLLDNLERILEVEISRDGVTGVGETPHHRGAEAEGESEGDLESVCVICYVYEFEGESPEVICDCGSLYHKRCLADLVINDCTTKGKRNCVDCPACQMELKVSKPSKATMW